MTEDPVTGRHLAAPGERGFIVGIIAVKSDEGSEGLAHRKFLFKYDVQICRFWCIFTAINCKRQ